MSTWTAINDRKDMKDEVRNWNYFAILVCLSNGYIVEGFLKTALDQ